MLKQLILENWKSFRYAELPLDPLTVLIGTNASGKSNVVEALEFLQRIARGENIEATLAGDKTLPSIRGGIDWAARKPYSEFTLKAIIQTIDNTTDLLYEIKVQTKPDTKIVQEAVEVVENYNQNFHENMVILSRHNLKQSCLSEAIGQFNNIEKEVTKVKDVIKIYHNTVEELKALKIQLENLEDNIDNNIWKSTISERVQSLDKLKTIIINQIPTHNKSIDNIKILNNDLKNEIEKIKVIISKLINVFVINPIPSKMRSYSSISDVFKSDASNIAGVLAALPDERKAEVEATLSAYIKNFPESDIKKVFAEPVGRLKTDAMLYCEEEWKPGETTLIDAKTMSDGTLRFLAILTALLTRPEGSQIVIEEIDNGLHPSRAELLVRMLRDIGRKRKIDILLTTHNPAFLDALGPEIVSFVVVAHRDSETGESKLTLLEDIDNFSKLFASYSLGDMTTKGAIERSLSRSE
ncbi:AAA family ATPase [Dendronalium sp. ChiSLP03b]|uniref:AAA family ATPase n=1 Tax=Dendronalium sp. ChiSLP03b TaxID=3075381 RepID=UPI002AD51AA8|nr:AAA family ATPase [Dendronalium sp. ChiSLP03b]MDZ8208269.1 AAA family ATPase [Dendronalium sp. ChiSLP03b]